MTCPFYLMMSGGGVTTVENAARFPIRLVESGPAGGAILAAHVARECGLTEALSLDMGGTTAKICLIENGAPERSRPSRWPAGTGTSREAACRCASRSSRWWRSARAAAPSRAVDEMDRLRVGPASAGSEPGPACYGRGGSRATVTDANLVLGKLDPERFAGGKIGLETDRAEDALGRDVGDRLGLAGRVARGRGRRDGGREHGQRGPGPRPSSGEGVIGAPYPGRVRGRGSAARGKARREARNRSGGDPEGGRGVGSAIGFLLAPIAFEVCAFAADRLSRLRRRRRQLDARRDVRGSVARRAGRGGGGRGPLPPPDSSSSGTSDRATTFASHSTTGRSPVSTAGCCGSASKSATGPSTGSPSTASTSKVSPGR